MSAESTISKPSGGDSPEGPISLHGIVDEASAESFPCSDPPAFTSMHVGIPTPLVELGQTAEPQPMPRDASDATIRRLARAQGIYLVGTGLWPVVHMPSFEAVTGRKTDRWLVRALGLVIASIGGGLVLGAREREGVPRSLLFVAVSTPAALAGISGFYALFKRRISKVYLLDALVELGIVAGWGALLRGTTLHRRS